MGHDDLVAGHDSVFPDQAGARELAQHVPYDDGSLESGRHLGVPAAYRDTQLLTGLSDVVHDDAKEMSVDGDAGLQLLGPVADRRHCFGSTADEAMTQTSDLATRHSRQIPSAHLAHPLGVWIRHGDNNLQGFEVVKRCLHWLR